MIYPQGKCIDQDLLIYYIRLCNLILLQTAQFSTIDTSKILIKFNKYSAQLENSLQESVLVIYKILLIHSSVIQISAQSHKKHKSS